MSDPRITDEAIEAGASAIGDLYGHPPDDYRIDARSALEAGVPLLAPQPVVDREQIAMKLSLVRFSDEESDRMIELTMREAWPLADAVLALINGSEESAPEESLGSTLRRLRERADLSQEELAAKAQVSRASIQNWEADRRAPRRAESRRLAAALGVSGVTPQELGKNDKS
jgi:DNA-binding transcriptional regulator YiaG